MEKKRLILNVLFYRIKEDMDRVDRQLVEAEATVEGSGVLKNFVPLIFVSAYKFSLPVFNKLDKELFFNAYPHSSHSHSISSLAGTEAFKFGRRFRGLRSQLSTCSPVQRRRVLPEAARKVRELIVVRL